MKPSASAATATCRWWFRTTSAPGRKKLGAYQRDAGVFFDEMRQQQDIACDCYPYSASSSTLDMKQVTDEFDIVITGPKRSRSRRGKTLQQIANEWQVSLHDAAARLMPAGAIYYNMDEQDVRRVMRYPVTMIGSDGLPNDPMPHPRLWGAFPRVLGHYSRDEQLFPLTTAVHKMTGLSAARFQLADRGLVKNWLLCRLGAV